MELTPRFTEAVDFALAAHNGHDRKGSRITGAPPVPYASHLLAVSAIVLEDHGDEDQAIAALLHDTVEDRGVRLDEIAARFGADVATIVRKCSDVIPEYKGAPKPPWGPRKAAYIADLRALDGPLREGILRVSLADKVHNLGATVREARLDSRVWLAFSTGPGGQLGYYRALAGVYRAQGVASPLQAQFEALIAAAEGLVGADDLQAAEEYERRLTSGW